MSATVSLRNSVLGAASILVIALTALPASAVNLVPGAGVGLPGTAGSPTPGTIILDELIPFEVRGTGHVLLYAGTLQNRVKQLDRTGTLAFHYRIRDTQGSLNGMVSAFATVNFSGFTTDVDFDTTSPGTVAPSRSQRSTDGSSVSFLFGNGYVFSGLESRTVYISTNATRWARGGSTTIILSTGESVIVPTVQPVKDDTPPVVAITSPNPLECVCNPVQIMGTANDPESFDHYVVEYSVGAGGPWTTIVSSTTPVINGLLASWDVSALPQGYYFIRLTAFNAVEMSSSITTIVFVDKQFDTVDVRSPGNGAILGGIICFDGSINDGNGNCATTYTIEYATSLAGPWNPVDPTKPICPGPVYNDPLGSWNTRAGIADSGYYVRVVGTDACGHTKTVLRKLTVDNTAPTAVITDPTNCESVEGLVKVYGTAADIHLSGWTLQYTGGDAHGWVTIATGTTSVVNGLLATWDTSSLRHCAYTLRLIVNDSAGIDCSGYTNQSEYLVSVYVGVRGVFDYDGDGDVDLDDFGLFQRCFSGPAIPADPECLN